MGDGSGVTGAGGGAGVSAAERALAPKEALESVSPLLITVFGANVNKVACACHTTASSLTPLAKHTGHATHAIALLEGARGGSDAG